MQTVTNSQIDALAAAVASPYGPLTRVSDFEDTDLYPEPNSGLRGVFTSALSVSVSLSYDELHNTPQAWSILEKTHGWTTVVTAIKTFATNFKALADTVSGTPYTYEDYDLLVSYIRENNIWTPGTVL